MASADDNDTDSDLTGGRKRHRSPNHPSVDLQKALDLAEKILNEDGTHSIPVGVAHDRWNYKRHSAAANQLVAALKSYGLMDVSGVGEKRSVRITESAKRIIKKAPNREQLIQEAALLPDIHLELWEKYKANGGLPKDDVLKVYLHWERVGGTFNEDAIDSFIANLRSTFRLAGIEQGDKMEEEDEYDGPDNGSVSVGSRVQWTSQGINQFPTPKLVVGFNDDGEWAFLDGESTGVPVSELRVVEPPEIAIKHPAVGERPSTGSPPPNPFLKTAIEVGEDVRRVKTSHAGPFISFPLSGGKTFELRLSDPISKKDFERLKKLIELSEDSLVEESEQ